MAITDFAGSVAVITGGASGIGLATAKALHARDANVVLADINASRLEQAKERLQQAAGKGQVLTVPTDVTQESQVQAVMKQAVDTFGRIDLVVTCAGIGRGGLIDMFTASEMQTLMNINFMGTYHCIQAALPTMRQQHAGYFVLLSSVAGKLGTPLLSGYCASKWAIRGFSAALRAELYGTGIDITTVYPAWVDTPMVHQEGMEQFFDIQILLTPEQVAEAILEAVSSGQHDLTLAPNPDIAFALQLAQQDQDQVERILGESFQRQMAKVMGQQA